MPNEIDRLAAFAESLADVSREIVRGALETGFSHELKGDGSPVTEVDKAVERALRERIAASYPSHGVIGEEYGDDQSGAELVWVIDPIDGTRQFIAGLPLYGSLIALARGGRFVLGVMEFQASQDRWVGGEGVPASFNGRPITTRACPALAQAMVSAGNPIRGAAAEQAGRMALARACRDTNWDGSSYGFGLVAGGRIDLAVDTGLDPFDYGAAVPVIEAAGGAATDWQGRPLTLESGNQVLMAGDPALIDQARRLLEAGA